MRVPIGRLLTALLLLGGLADPQTADAAGDAFRGERVFQKCYACHDVDPAVTGLPGPNLHGVVGRPAGALDGFDFSAAMIEAGRERSLVWTEEALDAFLADPEGFLPGTSMTFVGLRSAEERRDVIAYLRRAAADGQGP